MPTTQTLRDQYRRPFITGFVRSGSKYGRPICDYSSASKVTFYAGGAAYPAGRITLKFHPDAGEAFYALAAVFHHHGYAFEEPAGGSVSCRNITGATSARIDLQVSCQCPKATSLHAHGIAFDINPSRNRYRRASGPIQWGRQTDLPPELVADAEAIRTKAGKRVFEWGGRWTNTKDPMHFELDLLRVDLTKGINRDTVAGLEAYAEWLGGGGPPPTPPDEEEQMLKKGDQGNAVRKIQTALKRWNPAALPEYGVDGDYGTETETWVRNYQTAADLEPTGNTDGLTGAFLLEYVPDEAGSGGPGDSYTKAEANARFAAIDHPHTAKTTVT